MQFKKKTFGFYAGGSEIFGSSIAMVIFLIPLQIDECYYYAFMENNQNKLAAKRLEKIYPIGVNATPFSGGLYLPMRNFLKLVNFELISQC